jgi:hypothetical protein
MQSDAYYDARRAFMKAITLRNLPDLVADAVQTKAATEHLSISKAIVVLLEEHISESKSRIKKKRDLSYMVNTMSAKDAKDFDEALKEQRQIDPEMWK